MIQYLEHDEGIEELARLFTEERLIPVFGAGFTKGASAFQGKVPDGDECTKLMKDILRKYVKEIPEESLQAFDFNQTAKRLRNAVSRSIIPEKEYTKFFKHYFTDVTIESINRQFLELPWPYAFTINVDDGIENTGLFDVILPYQHARKAAGGKRVLYKLHGDAAYEIKYEKEDNIVFDSDQYTQSLNSESNQSMRENFSNAYKEFNLVFIGCSLKNEPDIKYIYKGIAKERLRTMGIVLRTERLSEVDEEDLEDYGITHIILVKDFSLFYIDFFYNISEKLNQGLFDEYPFINPKVQHINDSDYKFFSGYRLFDEKNNLFYQSDLFIDRDCMDEIDTALEQYNIVFVEGRRFSGKTALLCKLCEKEKRRTVFFFPSTTLENSDVIQKIVEKHKSGLLLFDSNALSVESYYMLRDEFDILIKNDNRIVIVLNQSDNYLSEIINSDYILLKNSFTDREIERLIPKTNKYGFTKRRLRNTNLDYLKVLEQEQKLSMSLSLNLPSKYTRNEQILLLLLCVKDKVYSRDINSLRIKNCEIKNFISRTKILLEWVKTAKGERNTYSTHKLVHNSKNILLEEIKKIDSKETIEAIRYIVITFRNGDNNQKRMFREVMQFDTLNQLFGRKKGAGKLIFQVYENLEQELKDDLHFWLQRSKSIYRLATNDYWKLKTAYSYAKKVYLDSENSTLTAKAALTISLICGLIYDQERGSLRKRELQEEAINLGYQAIFSEYYRQEKRLRNDLSVENARKNYSELIHDLCQSYIQKDTWRNRELNKKAKAIIEKLQ